MNENSRGARVQKKKYVWRLMLCPGKRGFTARAEAGKMRGGQIKGHTFQEESAGLSNRFRVISEGRCNIYESTS